MCLPDPLITGLEDESLAELLETSPGRFLPFPTRYEIHDYRIIADFVSGLPAGRAQEALEAAICRKGGLPAGSKAGSVITTWNSAGMRTVRRHTTGSRCAGVRSMASPPLRRRAGKTPGLQEIILYAHYDEPAIIAVPDIRRHPVLFLFLLLLNTYCLRIRKV